MLFMLIRVVIIAFSSNCCEELFFDDFLCLQYYPVLQKLQDLRELFFYEFLCLQCACGYSIDILWYYHPCMIRSFYTSLPWQCFVTFDLFLSIEVVCTNVLVLNIIRIPSPIQLPLFLDDMACYCFADDYKEF